MAGEDDPPWEKEFAADDKADKTVDTDAEETVIDGRQLEEAIPEPVASKDTTGKYKTLPGFAEALEHTREHYEALGEIRGIKRVLTAFRLICLGAGDHPDTADVRMFVFQRWITENEELIDVVMKDEG